MAKKELLSNLDKLFGTTPPTGSLGDEVILDNEIIETITGEVIHDPDEEISSEIARDNLKLDRDLDYVVENSKRLLRDASDVLDAAGALATSSESPSSISAYSALLTTLNTINKTIVDVHRVSRTAKSCDLKTQANNKTQVINNTYKQVNNTVVKTATTEEILAERESKKLS